MGTNYESTQYILGFANGSTVRQHGHIGHQWAVSPERQGQGTSTYNTMWTVLYCTDDRDYETEWRDRLSTMYVLTMYVNVETFPFKMISSKWKGPFKIT